MLPEVKHGQRSGRGSPGSEGQPVSVLAELFVGRPLNILLVAVALLAGQLVVCRWCRHSRGLLLSGGAWSIYAAWEWLVQARSPQANITVDLLLIWPALALVTTWGLCRAVKTAATGPPLGS